ncbi:MAG: hypothetical protein JWP61_2392, partial [Friedmanniella sp.]|nr:hypothetical protein [Friedmanniella sp.]
TDDPAEVWKAMDAGLDPTAVGPAAPAADLPAGPAVPPAPSTAPDVRILDTGDRMEPSEPGTSSQPPGA